MKKFTRREFIKLSSIWGVVPFLPKQLLIAKSSPEEEPEEDTSSSWENSYDSPYFLEGGASIKAWRRREGESAVDWYTRMESEE